MVGDILIKTRMCDEVPSDAKYATKQKRCDTLVEGHQKNSTVEVRVLCLRGDTVCTAIFLVNALKVV